MVAYSFKAQFVSAIESGEKQQTLRDNRKRHARVGEEVQLYSAMRTKQCRLIGRAICLSAGEISLCFAWPSAVVLEDGGFVRAGQNLDTFARIDGFADWDALVAFWRRHHPNVRDGWTGVRIRWGGFRAA